MSQIYTYVYLVMVLISKHFPFSYEQYFIAFSIIVFWHFSCEPEIKTSLFWTAITGEHTLINFFGANLITLLH